MRTEENNHHFLKGGGEMGALMRAFDWSQTAVGAPDLWPQSLRTVIALLLSSKFPMFLWWGDDMIQFYNDAYRPSLGNDGKHPSALGQKGKDCWPEIWDIIYPLIAQVRTTGEATWSEDQLIPIYRNRKIEDVYWTFSYSPVSGESEKVEGVFVVCTETTEKVNNLRQIEESEARFRIMTEALIQSEGRFQGAVAALNGILWTNNAMGEMEGEQPGWANLTGQSYEEYQGYGWAKAVHPDDAQPTIDAWNEALREQKTFVFEHRVKNKKGNWVQCSIRAIPLFNEDRSIREWVGVHTDITEQRNAEQALKESERRYRTLIEEGTVATALYTGPEIRIQYVNDTMLRYWGKNNSVIGKTFREALPELEGQSFPRLMDEVYTTGKTYTGKEELAYLEVDGQLQPAYYNFTYKALRKDDGTIYGIHHAAINVTEQVIARKKVEESEQKVRAIVESAPFPIAVYTGKEMRIELANQSILDIWGKGNDVIGKLFTEVLPELGSQEVFTQIEGVLTSGIAFHTRHQRLDLIVNGQSRPYWFNYSFTPLFDASGHVYGVMNTGADNTDLILAKLKVEENENNIRNTILKAPVAMCILRGKRQVVEIANNRMIELWGKTTEDVMNRPLFEGVPEAKDQGFEKYLDDVFTTGEAFVAQGVPVTLPRNGKIEQVYVNFVYEAFREANGEISGVIAVATDVTDQVIARQQIEEVVAERTKELAEANDNLQKSNAELAQFAYIASHDLQEPVRKVSTFAQMLHQSLGDIDDRSLKYLGKITTATSRMTALIRDVLSYSQLSREKEVFKQVDLQQVVENIIGDFELLIEQKQAIIKYNDLPVIYAIPLQMSQLFGNLVSNALKFSKDDVPPVITITGSLLSKQEAAIHLIPNENTAYYSITLKDNGIGFKQEYAAQIFNIFQRLHGKSEYAGTGIGLAMCKKIAQNHHGDIYATGTDEGAIFNIILPVRPAAENIPTEHNFTKDKMQIS